MEQYELYCLGDRYFYDRPTERTEHADFAIGGRSVPHGWGHEAGELWVHYAPRGLTLPAQGWKIHVSACLEGAERAPAAGGGECGGRGVPFQVLRGEAALGV